MQEAFSLEIEQLFIVVMYYITNFRKKYFLSKFFYKDSMNFHSGKK